VRYYSTERGEWEEIPLEMVDMDRTKSELAEHASEVAADAKAEAEERAAEKLAKKQVASIPTQAGAYYIRGDAMEPLKQAESKIVNKRAQSCGCFRRFPRCPASPPWNSMASTLPCTSPMFVLSFISGFWIMKASTSSG
jgi:hypothetical protein